MVRIHSEQNPAGTLPIPYPPRRMLLGNLPDINNDKPLQSEMELARRYGPIFELAIFNRRMVILSSQKLVNEVCDETRFDKKVWAPLQHVRAFSGDGLFTAWTQEPNWHKAHNILLPNFSTRAMQGYIPQMLDIARQLMDKWSRLNPDDEIDVPADMTRLTLDTIGLCGFNYRFNSFYRENPHPFVEAIVRALGEALDQGRRLPVQDRLMVLHRRQFQDDISTMNMLVDTIIRERRAAQSPDEKPIDLLGYMLTGKDKATGAGLDDLNIRYQIITFLIAGHETTSGLLSFAIYFLLKHPDVLAKAYAEVDRVLGGDPDVMPTYSQVHQLAYVRQILNESLRLWPTAPAFALYPYQPAIIGDKYAIDKTQTLQVLIPMLHRDPAVWGEDAEQFNPDHFSPEREQALPPNSFKPFGNGQRACIGRQFAMQEAMLVMGMLLQRFEFIDYTNYQLDVKETLTLKPANFHIKIRPRPRQATVAVSATQQVQPVAPVAEPAPVAPPTTLHNTPLLVLYGSNLGTAEDLARQIANDGTTRGFRTVVAPLDDYAGNLPVAGAVVIVTSSYNGTPPDNAGRFCDWLKSGDLLPNAFAGVHYTVFGCGNRDWTATYQAIPKFVDTQLAEHGAARIHPRGEGDARDDFDGQFRAWYGPLWSDIATSLDISTSEEPVAVHSHRYEVELVTAEPAAPLAAAYGAVPVMLVENRELQQGVGTNPPERSTRHIVIALPEGVTYRTGDYLGVLPRNGSAIVHRVAGHFKLSEETIIRIRSNTGTKSSLPLDKPVTAGELLRDYVELQDVATRSQIAVLAAYNPCPPEQQQLLALSSDDPANVARYRETILEPRLSVIDLLETFPACDLPFNIFLELLTPLRPRYYSISSSPMVDPRTASITVAVVSGPARSGHGIYNGVCSSYLAAQPSGMQIMAFIRNPNTPFRMPQDPRIPLIMVGPGTGLAPFRGFLQERAALKAQGRGLGPALLFFGCRNPDIDFIYHNELESWQQEGIEELVVAFSRVPGQPRQYVQDKIKQQADEIWQLLQAGGVIYVCGDASKMAPDVRRAFARIYMTQTGADEPAAETWLDSLVAEHRYVADVWAS